MDSVSCWDSRISMRFFRFSISLFASGWIASAGVARKKRPVTRIVMFAIEK
jgi:hypothetical protein